MPRLLAGLGVSCALLLTAGCAAWKPPGESTATAPAAVPAAGGSPHRHGGKMGGGQRGPAADGTTPPGQPQGAGAGQARGPGAGQPQQQRPPPRPFDTVVKGATRHDGYLPMWEHDGQWWLEIAPERLNQPFLLSVNVTRSVGERGLYAGQMGPNWLVEFQRVGQQMQVVARNLAFRGDGDAAVARTAAQGYSDSLIAAMPVASAPQEGSGAVLMDAAFLLGDIPGYSRTIERAFRIGYQIDVRNSRIDRVRSGDDLTAVHTTVHYATQRIPLPPSGPQAAAMPQPPRTTPDPRSLLVGFVYSFSALPAQPMRPRLADPRVGHFTETYTDLTRDGMRPQRVHPIRRWRLEPTDPQAAASPPLRPVEFWLDRNIPRRYIDAVEAGVLAWNEAFERVGLPGAIITRRQGEDEDDDGMEASRASVRWYSGADAGFSIGPSHTDPRTGEILSAHIAISDSVTRGARRMFVDQIDVGHGQEEDTTGRRLAQLTAPWRDAQAWVDGVFDVGTLTCGYAAHVSHEAQQAVHTMIVRDGLEPDDPRIEAFVQAVVTDLVMHEVGHTLGLRHNFKASAAYADTQLRDPAFSELHGLSASVMDYNAVNLNLRGEPDARLVNARIGPYDQWAIEYAYRPLPPAQEAQALARIAARAASEPMLAYADDTDAGGFGAEGIDPTANRFDLGADPLGHAQRRVTIAHELWQRVQAQEPGNAQAVLRQRRALGAGFGYLQGAAAVAGKYIGGMMQDRGQLGDEDLAPGRIYTPVDPRQQARALTLLTETLFAADSFHFQPRFLASLPPDHLDRSAGAGPVNIPNAVLRLQSTALDRLLSPGTAQRLLDLPSFGDDNNSSKGSNGRLAAITLAGMLETVQDAVWSELDTGKEIPRLRRNLQREHLRRLLSLLTGPPSTMPADAVSLTRYHAVRLQARLQQAAQGAERRTVSIETRAHLEESLGALTQALRASMLRG